MHSRRKIRALQRLTELTFSSPTAARLMLHPLHSLAYQDSVDTGFA